MSGWLGLLGQYAFLTALILFLIYLVWLLRRDAGT